MNPTIPIREENGTSTHAVNCHTIQDVGAARVLTGTHVAREKAQRERFYGGESKPSHFATNVDRRFKWREGYKRLWELKLRLVKEDNG